MSVDLDEIDRKILRLLQKDAAQSIDSLSIEVALSRNACWRRVKRFEGAGVIASRVALLSADALGLDLQAIVQLRLRSHDAQNRKRLVQVLDTLPEVTAAFRMTGDLDYLLRVHLTDMRAYDAFYQRLTEKLELEDVSASFVMEAIKDTTELPV